MDRPPSSRWVPLAGIAAAGIGALAACFPSADPDLWFHLALGRQWVQEGMPAVEGICALSRGTPFTNHEWLWDLLAYGAWQAGGLPAVLAGRVLSAALLFGLCWAVALRLGARPLTALWALVLAVPVVRPWLGDRPHVLAYALAAAMALGVLDRRPPGARHLALLGSLAALWANIHGSFPLAVALAGLPFARRETWRDPGARRRWAAALVVVALATLLNPWGPAIHATVAHHRGAVYRILSEWAPWNFAQDPARDLALGALVGGAAAGFLARSRRRALDEVLLLGIFLVPFWRAEKFAPGLLVGAAPVLAAHVSLRTWAVPVRTLAAAATLAAGALARPGYVLDLSLDFREMPREAVAWAREAGVRGPVFHPFNVGGYVAFFGLPDLEPLLDGRIYIHGERGLAAYFGALGSGDRLRELTRSLGIQGVLADRQDASFQGMVERLDGDPEYALAWLDDRFAWFLPAGRARNPFRALRAGTDPRYLLDLSGDRVDQARAEADRVRETGRGEETRALVTGLLALREARIGWNPDTVFQPEVDRIRSGEAAEVLGELSRMRPDVPMFGYFRGLALAGAGRCREAREALAGARAFPDARRLLERLAREGCPGESGEP